MGLSALVPSGVLIVWPLLAAATLGAIAGDTFAFWLGHHYHARILSAWPFFAISCAVRHSERFFEKYGARSIFFARSFRRQGIRSTPGWHAGHARRTILRGQRHFCGDLGSCAYFARHAVRRHFPCSRPCRQAARRAVAHAICTLMATRQLSKIRDHQRTALPPDAR